MTTCLPSRRGIFTSTEPCRFFAVMLIVTMSSAKPYVHYPKFTAAFVVTCHTYDTLALFFIVRAAYVVLILQILVLRFMEILYHLASHFLNYCGSALVTYLRGAGSLVSLP
jgi:hypothetical protein